VTINVILHFVII